MMRQLVLIVALVAVTGFGAEKVDPALGPAEKDAPVEKATEAEAAAIRAAIEKLGADDFQAREKATQELAAAGLKAKPFLEAAHKQNDAEVEARVVKLLEKLKPKDYVTLPSGLGFKVIKEGTGESPSKSGTVTVNYSGRHENGLEFDSSAKHGKAVSFPVSAVIPGWTEGLQKMKVGGKYRLIIPAHLAYGNNPPPGSDIAAGETLIFDIELLDVK